jgi:hypothetical protein
VEKILFMLLLILFMVIFFLLKSLVKV